MARRANPVAASGDTLFGRPRICKHAHGVRPLSSEVGTCTTVKARFWPWILRESPSQVGGGFRARHTTALQKWLQRLLAQSQVHRQSPLGPADPSFRTLSGRLKFMVRRHKFNKDSSITARWWGASKRRCEFHTKYQNTKAVRLTRNGRVISMLIREPVFLFLKSTRKSHTQAQDVTCMLYSSLPGF